MESGASRANLELRIVARTNKVGIDRDVRLLTDALAALGIAPAFSHYRSISPLRRYYGRRHHAECLVFLERITARWLRHAGRYLLIPNQERYPARLVPLLRHMDHILCKSRHAHDVFAALHPSVHFIGFTSVDRALSDVEPDYTRFFHLAGGSSMKGTDALLRVWQRHSDWPRLTIVDHSRNAPDRVPPNVELIRDYVPDSDLQKLQNACGIHLCPSVSEGWGHHIVEAMSCRAVTLVTDAPPMNEHVQADRGVLVPYGKSEPRKLGVSYFVDERALEGAIAELIAAPRQAKRALGQAARVWFEDNDRSFRENLRRVTREVLPDHG